jgi:hypothetical protein
VRNGLAIWNNKGRSAATATLKKIRGARCGIQEAILNGPVSRICAVPGRSPRW